MYTCAYNKYPHTRTSPHLQYHAHLCGICIPTQPIPVVTLTRYFFNFHAILPFLPDQAPRCLKYSKKPRRVTPPTVQWILQFEMRFRVRFLGGPKDSSLCAGSRPDVTEYTAKIKLIVDAWLAGMEEIFEYCDGLAKVLISTYTHTHKYVHTTHTHTHTQAHKHINTRTCA